MEVKGKRVLVAAGPGFIGSHLLDKVLGPFSRAVVSKNDRELVQAIVARKQQMP